MATGIKPGILKLINYKNADMEALLAATRYVGNEDKSPVEYQRGYLTAQQNLFHSIKLCKRRWHVPDGREFKHGIVSFGDPLLTPEEALEICDDIVSVYASEYPLLLCVHTDVPRRIHAHWVMGMVNVRTGKKFSQSQAEFQAFREHVSGVMVRHGLLPLKGTETRASPVSGREVARKATACQYPVFDTDKAHADLVEEARRIKAERQRREQRGSAQVFLNLSCDMKQAIRELMSGVQQMKFEGANENE